MVGVQCIAKDVAWRDAQGVADNLRKDRNAVQNQVKEKKKAKEPCDDLVAQIADVRAPPLKGWHPCG